MNIASTTEKVPYPIYFIIIILPYLIFYWMCPFVAELTLGMDYPRFSIEQQMELLFSIKTGSFPQYVPGFNLGHSSVALTLSQIYHPISHIASILPGYWSGYALEWNTLLRLLSLGFTHLALFVFLRKLRLNIILSFLLSLITVYNLRMLDLFRYGVVEAYVGHLLLCIAIGWYLIYPNKILAPVAIIGATYLLVCSGHPQMMYYGLLGAGVFSLVAPFFLSTLLIIKQINLKVALRYWIKIWIFMVIGVLLSSAYIMPFYFDFILMNVQRIGQSYSWADGYRDTFLGTISNFFMPLFAGVTGNFGGSSLFLIAAALPLLKCFRVRISRIAWIIWGLIPFVFLYMQGSRTPVHWLFWKYFPFMDDFRIAGRITIFMPILILMILVWIMRSDPVPVRIKGRSVMMMPSQILALASLFFMLLFLSVLAAVYFLAPSLLRLSPSAPVSLFLRNFNPETPLPLIIVLSITIISGIASLLLMALYDSSSKYARTIGILLCVATFIHLGTMLKHGTYVQKKHDMPTYDIVREQKKIKLDYYHDEGLGLSSSVNDLQAEESFVEPFLGKLYYNVIPVSDQKEAYSRMQQHRLPQQLFIEEYKPETNHFISAIEQQNIKGNVELIYSSFNRLRFRVATTKEAFMGLSYPFTGQWHAWVNNNKVEIYRANGAAHAIQVPAGKSLVEFRYFSKAALGGIIISCSTFLLIGLYLCFNSLSGSIRILAFVIILVLGVGVFMLWYSSLYSGENLDSKYNWTYAPPSLLTNLAYGKKTRMEPSHHLLKRKSSRAVDGNRSPGAGFTTPYSSQPNWIVDLSTTELVRKIVIYESNKEESANTRPLYLNSSIDGEKWNTIATIISQKQSQFPIEIALEKPNKARFIRINAGSGFLSLDEVEIN